LTPTRKYLKTEIFHIINICVFIKKGCRSQTSTNLYIGFKMLELKNLSVEVKKIKPPHYQEQHHDGTDKTPLTVIPASQY
jgi:hypothetical protein